jgi:hypothetical protein
MISRSVEDPFAKKTFVGCVEGGTEHMSEKQEEYGAWMLEIEFT